MPPRLPSRLLGAQSILSTSPCPACQIRLASVITTASVANAFDAFSPISRQPPTAPRSHKHPALRKSQLHRQYQSLLRSSPILLLFQHNNLKASEWAAIRRELASALALVNKGDPADATVSASSKMHILNTGIFESALRVVEFWTPPSIDTASSDIADSKSKRSNTPKSGTRLSSNDPRLASSHPVDTSASNLEAHGLSETAWRIAKRESRRRRHGLEPLLSGPLAALAFPAVSPAHVAAALKILAPGDKFPAPKRKASPAYYEPEVQGGLQKLMLLGARVEGKAMDMEGVRWVGGVEGGITGLRAQLVGLLSGAGMGLAGVLESASKSLYMAVEGRRMALEDEAKGPAGNEATASGSSDAPADQAA